MASSSRLHLRQNARSLTRRVVDRDLPRADRRSRSSSRACRTSPSARRARSACPWSAVAAFQIWPSRIRFSSSLRDLDACRIVSLRNARFSRSIFCRSCFLVFSSFSLREKTLMSMTMPSIPGGAFSEASRTSPALSPKMARSSLSSGVSSVSPLGVTLPTRMSPGLDRAPMRMMPSSSRFLSASSPTFGMSRVISSFPRLVSRTCSSNSSMWIEVKMSSLDQSLADDDGVLEVVAAPGHEGDEHVRPSASSPSVGAGPSAMTWPFLTFSPFMHHAAAG